MTPAMNMQKDNAMRESPCGAGNEREREGEEGERERERERDCCTHVLPWMLPPFMPHGLTLVAHAVLLCL